MATFVHPDGLRDSDLINDRDYWALWVNVDDWETLSPRAIPQVNQYKYAKSKSACTIVNAYKDLCYLRDHPATDWEMIAFIDYAVTQWYKVWQWWFADKAMKSVMEYWNATYPDKLVSYVKILRTDADFTAILKKNFMLWCTYKWNSAYNKDYQWDLILNWETFGTSTYGHRTSILLKDNKIMVEDSAAGNKYNEYELKQFTKLIQNWVYNPNFYLFIPQVTNKEEISRLNKMSVACQMIIDNCNIMKSLSTDPIFQNEMQQTINEIIQKQQDIKNGLSKLK